MTTTFTERDRARVDHGLLPIDVDPPRRLTRHERWTLFSHAPAAYMRLRWRRFVPHVCRGFVRWTEAA